MPTPSAPRPSRTRLAATVLAAVSLAWVSAGCAEQTDLGRECELIRRSTDAERAAGAGPTVPILEGELADGQDTISFGVTTCDDLVCVRDRNFPSAAASAIAKGYCSAACVPDVSTCQVTDDRALPGIADNMRCRSLLLDEATLNAIRVSNPDFYQSVFGDNQSGAFCASGPASDDAAP